MSASMTFQHSNAIDAFGSRFFVAISRTIDSLSSLLSARQSHEPRTADELLEWAHQYESTQPSYAADLRAAALRFQNQQDQ
jgi:hypothetical protein